MEIKKFDIWLLDFDPSIWNEIQKTRPAIVLSNDFFNISSWTIFVVPLSSIEPKIKNSPFHFKIEKNNQTNLSSDSYANISQFRSVSKLRFIKKIWEVDKDFNEKVMKWLFSILDFGVLSFKYLK